MKRPHSTYRPGRAASAKQGFSLVEVALALMVLAVGLTATFALFPTGLDLNRESQEDSQMSLFAEDVAAALQAEAHFVSKAGRGFDSLVPGKKISITMDSEWAGGTTAELVCSGDPTSPRRGWEELEYVVPAKDGSLTAVGLYYSITFKDILNGNRPSSLAPRSVGVRIRVRPLGYKDPVAFPNDNEPRQRNFYTVIREPAVKL